jgi:hypothetical protein
VTDFRDGIGNTNQSIGEHSVSPRRTQIEIDTSRRDSDGNRKSNACQTAGRQRVGVVGVHYVGLKPLEHAANLKQRGWGSAPFCECVNFEVFLAHSFCEFAVSTTEDRASVSALS